MITHPRVAEAAAVGVPDDVKGEAVWAFWVPRSADGTEVDAEPADPVSAELAALVGRELGRPFTPSRVWRVTALPKTRSAKIMRRAIRAAALGIDPGDLSGAENPDAVGEIRRLIAQQVTPADG
jgi:acetyl-CoA synthetase